MEKHILTKMGVFQAQVCSAGTYDEALEWIRSKNPAGTTNNWFKKEEGDFAPLKCKDYPERMHYMFEC